MESLEGGAGLGREADGEVRIELEGAFEEGDGLRGLATSGGDHPGVKLHERVAGAEAKGLLAGRGRPVQIAATVERPGEDVPGDDAWPRGDLCPRLLNRSRQVFGAAVIGGVERQLEIGVDAVRGVQLLDGGDERVLRVRLVLSPSGAQHVAVPDDKLGQGDGPHRLRVELGGAVEVTRGGRHSRLSGQTGRVAGKGRQRRGVLGCGAGNVAAVEAEIAKLDADPGDVLGVAGAGGGRLLHGDQCALPVPHQLAQIGDARVRAEVGTEIDHRLDGLDRLVVAAELHLGVADHPVGRGVVGSEGAGLLAPIESRGELVASQGQRAEPDHRVDVVAVAGERLLEEGFGFRVVARIARFARLLQVRLTEHRRGQSLCALIVAAQRVLERLDAGVERRLRPLRRRPTSASTAEGPDASIAPAPDTLSSAGRMLRTPEMSATAASTAMRSRGNGPTPWVLR